MEDAFILGYDKAEEGDMPGLAICRVVNGKLIHIKTVLGDDANALYEQLTCRGQKV